MINMQFIISVLIRVNSCPQKLKPIMPTKKTTFRILRYKPGRIDPPRYQEFSLAADPDMSVLEVLEVIRFKQDSTLMYRHSCHHSSCGTCACKINGREQLACTTKLKDLNQRKITLKPLDGFDVIGDLVVDFSPIFNDIPEDWDYLKKSEVGTTDQAPAGITEFRRFENCIECGACISACPVRDKTANFMGPAALAALSSELVKSPHKTAALLAIAGNERGVHLCQRAFDCSRVCPTGVQPARHISDLRRRLQAAWRDAE